MKVKDIEQALQFMNEANQNGISAYEIMSAPQRPKRRIEIFKNDKHIKRYYEHGTIDYLRKFYTSIFTKEKGYTVFIYDIKGA